MYKKADAKKLECFAALSFQKAGLKTEDAELAAKILIDADLRGIETHGVMNLNKYYVKKIRDGIINKNPEIKIIQKMPAAAVMDADNSLGFISCNKAMDKAIEIAEEFGTGWVSVYSSSHCGAGAYYVMKAVNENMVGLFFSSGGTSVAGPNGLGRLIGNNVIAIGAPAGSSPPLVFDMAPAMSIANKAHIMSWENKKYPEGFVIDKDGKPVINPSGYFDPMSAVLPLGSDIIHGAHKGFGLLLMSDILTGALSGDGGSMLRNFGAETHAFCALKINAFTDEKTFKKLMDDIIEKIHNAPTVSGTGKMRYPGEKEDETYKDRIKNGIPLHEKIIEDLSLMSKDLGLPIDDMWM